MRAVSPDPGEPSELPVVVVGGGLAGLTAAWRLFQKKAPVVGFEASMRLGGLVQTEEWEGNLYEHGPDGFLLRKPQAKNLCDELGVPLQEIASLPRRIHIATGRGVHPLPEGLGLIVPTRWLPFWTSPLLSWRGKIRLAAERFLPGRTAEDPDVDESLGSFIRRRFGREVLATLAEPLLGGVWNTDPEVLSLRASFPQYARLEREFGSLLRGLKKKGAPLEGGGLVTPVAGTEELTRRLGTNAQGVWRTSHRVRSVEKIPGGYLVDFGTAEPLAARSVILAVPPREAARILADVEPQASRLLARIDSRGIGTISLTFRAQDVRPFDAWGVLFARSSKVRIDGQQWSSAKWGHRNRPDRVVVRAFFGGFRHPDFLNAEDGQIVDEVLASLKPWLKPHAEPLHFSIRRWRSAFPQLAVGHLDLIKEVERALSPGILLAGQGYHGVGMPAVIESAENAVATHLRESEGP